MVALCFMMVSVCKAAGVPLNDQIKDTNFIRAFNECAKREQSAYQIDGNTKIFRKPQNGAYLSHFIPNTKVRVGDNLIMIKSNEKGEIYEAAVYISRSSMVKDMFGEMFILERTVGMPNGEGHSDGMYAVIDAYKSGTGSYWSEATNRRYVVQCIGDRKIGPLGLTIKAEKL